MNTQHHAVKIDNVTKTFKDCIAVDNLSLTIPKGCVYGFIGPNGSGKTTTLRMIMNIFYPDSGTIKVLGQQRSKAYTDRIGTAAGTLKTGRKQGPNSLRGDWKRCVETRTELGNSPHYLSFEECRVG